MHTKRTAQSLLCLFLLVGITCGSRTNFSAVDVADPVASSDFQAAARGPETTISLPGLSQPVRVRRDNRGIPYISAQNDDDLYFAQGYVVASDRLWQMDLLRRTARGELAEIFGRAVLEEDKHHRLYGFSQVAEASLAHLSPQLRAAIDAYSRGVNAYIESHAGKALPPEFQILQYSPRAWTPADSLVVGKLFAETLSTTWQEDLMRAGFSRLPADKRAALFPEDSPLDVIMIGPDNRAARAASNALMSNALAVAAADPARTLCAAREQAGTLRRSIERVGLGAEDRAVSNNWVVAGSRTATGRPLLANDPHLPPSAPSIWYMAHLASPGHRVAGVTAPGSPGILLGHNERIAWGATALEVDVQDLYLERFDPANPRRYLTPAGWTEAPVRHEMIQVRQSLTGTATESVPFDVTVTRHGPIFFEKDGARYSLRWTALDPQWTEAGAFFRINYARDWSEFREALRDYPGPPFNFVYADQAGHIGYFGAAHLPIRRTGDGSIPYDGSTDAGDWTGFIPFDKLPQLFDPASGIIVTANNRLIGHGYPYFLTHEWPAPYRARRIYDLLQARQKLTVEDYRQIQADIYSIAAATFAREVVRTLRSSAAGPEVSSETLRLFEQWDGKMAADSSAAALAALMRGAFRTHMLEAALGPALAREYHWANSDTLIDRLITDRPLDWLPAEFRSYGELFRACEAEARATLKQRLGADQKSWTWGSLVQARFPHPLAGVPLIGQQFAVRPFPQNGSGGIFASGATVNVGANVSMRLITDPGDWDATLQGITLGESGNPASPHWVDQLDDWRAVAPRQFPFSEQAVNQAAQESLLLVPVGNIK